MTNFALLCFVLENSQSKWAQNVAASSLKRMAADHWCHFPKPDAIPLKDSVCRFLMNKGSQCDQQVLKMVIMLLVKILKLAWFDIPELQSVIADLVKLGSVSERHLLISLTALEEMIIEMGYVTRGKNLHLHRRISVNFRDMQLLRILENTLEQVRRYTDSVLANQAFSQIRIDGNSIT